MTSFLNSLRPSWAITGFECVLFRPLQSPSSFPGLSRPPQSLSGPSIRMPPPMHHHTFPGIWKLPQAFQTSSELCTPHRLPQALPGFRPKCPKLPQASPGFPRFPWASASIVSRPPQAYPGFPKLPPGFLGLSSPGLPEGPSQPSLGFPSIFMPRQVVLGFPKFPQASPSPPNFLGLSKPSRFPQASSRVCSGFPRLPPIHL